MNKFVIVADDFTGANDTGAQFSKKGLKTIVISDEYDFIKIKSGIENSDVLVINTESRFDSNDVAYDKYFTIGSILNKLGIINVYKKIDSTFRGNVGSEVKGLMNGLGVTIGLVAPAFPKVGRTTIDGKVYVNGELLENTSFAMDPRNPINTSDIKRFFKETCKDVNLVNLNDEIKIEEFRQANEGLYVFDASTNEDLEEISNLISTINKRKIIIGSGGLAEFIPKSYNLIQNKSVLGIVGSVNEAARNQIEYARDKVQNINFVKLNIEDVLMDKDDFEIERIRKIFSNNIDNNKDTLIYTVDDIHDLDNSKSIGKSIGLSISQVSDKIAKFLGKLGAILINDKKSNIGGLYLTGGDTAINVIKSLDVNGIEIIDEISSGIPYGYIVDKRFKDTFIVTKAGGFGEDNTIEYVYEFLRGENI